MKKYQIICLAISLGTLVLFASVREANAVFPAAMSDPSYLLIMKNEPDSFAAEFKPCPLESPRQVGFAVKVRMLSDPVEALRPQVDDALDKAERTGYPILITLDDWNFPGPSSDPEVIEWTNWPAPGEKYGPLVKGRWINWGSWIHTEPPPNYESAKFRADVKRRLKEGILSPIVARLKKWKSEKRSNLFAGLVIGWESGYYTFLHVDPNDLPKVEGLTFNRDEVVGTGYAALASRGYSAEKVHRLAQKRGCSEQAVMKDLMEKVVHDYVGFIAQTCHRGGIPRERLYSHYAALATCSPSVETSEDGRVLPVEGAVQNHCRPGITVTEPWCNLSVAARTLHNNGAKAWGAVEFEFTDSTRKEEAALAYLERLTQEGAKTICVYGWWTDENNPFRVRNTGAVPAMHRWLNQP